MRHLTFILILIFALAACAEDNTDDADIIEDDAVEAEATALLAPTFTIEIPDLDLTYPTEDLLGTVVAYEPVATPSLTFDALGDGAKVTFMFDASPTATGDYEIVYERGFMAAVGPVEMGMLERPVLLQCVSLDESATNTLTLTEATGEIISGEFTYGATDCGVVALDGDPALDEVVTPPVGSITVQGTFSNVELPDGLEPIEDA